MHSTDLSTLALWLPRGSIRPASVAAHGLRQDRRGNLLVPIRDAEGRLWSVQTIRATAPEALHEGRPQARDARHAGRTAARGAFGRRGSFDNGNLMDVARAYRERDPERLIIFAADNDHHLRTGPYRCRTSARRRQPPRPRPSTVSCCCRASRRPRPGPIGTTSWPSMDVQ
jgi:hypothetical protein